MPKQYPTIKDLEEGEGETDHFKFLLVIPRKNTPKNTVFRVHDASIPSNWRWLWKLFPFLFNWKIMNTKTEAVCVVKSTTRVILLQSVKLQELDLKDRFMFDDQRNEVLTIVEIESNHVVATVEDRVGTIKFGEKTPVLHIPE